MNEISEKYDVQEKLLPVVTIMVLLMKFTSNHQNIMVMKELPNCYDMVIYDGSYMFWLVQYV